MVIYANIRARQAENLSSKNSENALIKCIHLAAAELLRYLVLDLLASPHKSHPVHACHHRLLNHLKREGEQHNTNQTREHASNAETSQTTFGLQNNDHRKDDSSAATRRVHTHAIVETTPPILLSVCIPCS